MLPGTLFQLMGPWKENARCPYDYEYNEISNEQKELNKLIDKLTSYQNVLCIVHVLSLFVVDQFKYHVKRCLRLGAISSVLYYYDTLAVIVILIAEGWSVAIIGRI